MARPTEETIRASSRRLLQLGAPVACGDPKTPDPASTLSATLSNSLFTWSFPHYKPATDAPIALEVSPDLVNWSSVATTPSLDLGLTETLTHQETASAPARFFRLKCSRQ